MSRISFDCTIGSVTYIVTAGWDRPLQHYFGSIEDPRGSEDGEEEYLWASLDDPDSDMGGGFPTLECVLARMESVGVVFPDGFVDRAMEKLGNVFEEFPATVGVKARV